MDQVGQIMRKMEYWRYMYVVIIQLAIFNYSTVVIDYDMLCYILSLSTFLHSCAIKWITKVSLHVETIPVSCVTSLKFWEGPEFYQGFPTIFWYLLSNPLSWGHLIAIATKILELATNLKQKLATGWLKSYHDKIKHLKGLHVSSRLKQKNALNIMNSLE